MRIFVFRPTFWGRATFFGRPALEKKILYNINAEDLTGKNRYLKLILSQFSESRLNIGSVIRILRILLGT
jgi:hypothetical protein